MRPLTADQLGRVAEFLRRLDSATKETNVRLSTVSPWVEVDEVDAGELGWKEVGDGQVHYLLESRAS